MLSPGRLVIARTTWTCATSSFGVRAEPTIPTFSRSHSSTVNISSLVVDVRPERRIEVRETLRCWPGVDVHDSAADDGRLVVTIDADGDNAPTDTFDRIAALAGVMSVALVYHYLEPEPEQEA